MANDWRALVDEVIELQRDPEMKTAPGPAFQWYPQQWLGDPAVQLMSWEARGVHHHLLMLAWKGFDLDEDPVPCSIPGDPAVLSALCHHPGRWDVLWEQIARAWKAHESRLWNLGLVRSYLAQMSTRRSRKKAANARWGNRACKPDAFASTAHANASTEHANASSVHSSSSSSPSSERSQRDLSPPYPPRGPDEGPERETPLPDPDYLLSTNPGQRPWVHQETAKGSRRPRCGRDGGFVPVSGEWPKGGRRCLGCDSAGGRRAAAYPADFEAFMATYPKPRNWPAAYAAWDRSSADRPQNGKILASVEEWSASKEWTKDDGAFIPSPERFISGHMWNDEPGAKVPKPKTMAELYPAAARRPDGEQG
jgi:hypothetical protein